MCGRGRYSLYARRSLENIANTTGNVFQNSHHESEEKQIAPDASVHSDTIENLSPGMVCPVVVQGEDGNLNIVKMTWGLIPAYTDLSVKPNHFKLYNKRIDTLTRPGYFRKLAVSRRCLVILDGFYEWKIENGIKQPYYVSYSDRPLQIAGIYDISKRLNDSGAVVTFPTFSILTGEPSAKFSALHDREPVLLTDEQALRWVASTADLDTLLQELTGNPMRAALPINADLDYHPVTREVGKTSYQGLDCATPVIVGAPGGAAGGSKDIQSFFKHSGGSPKKRKLDVNDEAQSSASLRVKETRPGGERTPKSPDGVGTPNTLPRYFSKSEK